MTELSGFPYQEIQFDKKGRLVDPAEVGAADDMITGRQVTDLLILSHGWNNDIARARALYRELAEHLRATLDAGSGGGLPGRRLALVGLLWPAKKFAEEELIPGGAAGLGGKLTDADLIEQIEGLRDLFDDDTADRLEGLVPDLEDRRSARREFVDLVRGALDDLDDEATAEIPRGFFKAPGEKVLDDFAKPPPVVVGEGGGAAGIGDDDGDGGPRGFFGGVRAGARNVLNYLTYYKMKARAGKIGAGGVHDVVRGLHERHPEVKLHLAGHSFGGRLVTACALGSGQEPELVFDSMTLLQAAFSHNGFAERFDGENDGFFRPVVARRRVRGPIVITHTAADRAVGLAYPLASRLAGQNAAALGDKDDPFGGLGRNGAQRMRPDEVDEGKLLAAGGAYAFGPAKIFNLDADGVIEGHGDVARREVAHAIVEAVATT